MTPGKEHWNTVVCTMLIALLFALIGCNQEPSAAIKARAAELSSGFKQHAEVIGAKQDESLVILRENTTALAAIKSQVESLASETREATDTLKASLSSTNPNGKESDPESALEPQEPAQANQSQPAIPVASAPAVRSSGPLKLSWNVEGNWNPSILETAKHLREDHGIIADGMSHQQMHDLHAAVHEGRQVATKSPPVQLINRGSSCPGGVCPTVRTRRRR
jgi:hypothetical protein